MSLDPDPQRISPLDALPAGKPDAADHPATLEHLLSHVERLQSRHDQVSGQLAGLREQDQVLRHGLAKLDRQLERARQLQDDLLPRSLPECDGLRISKLYLPAKELSGDRYDVMRLDDHQVSINISDATGHDMAAAMISIFMKQAQRTGGGGKDGCFPEHPHELLGRLNDELAEADLTDCHFLTAIHGVYDQRDRCLLWARGGMPYPLMIRARRSPEQIISEGGLIGAFENQKYDLVSTHFEPGDVMLLFTDGLEALLLNTAPGRGAAKLLDTPWVRTLSARSLEAHLNEVEALARDTSPDDWPADDITVLTLEGIP